MTPVGWVALATALVVVGLPGRDAVRVDVLGDAGRLRAPSPASRPQDVRAVPSSDGELLPAPRLPTWMVVAASAVGAGVVVLVLSGVVLAVAAAAATGVTTLTVLDARRGRADLAARRRLHTAVGLLGAELTAGARPDVALGAAAAADPVAGRVLGAAAATARDGGDTAGVLLTGPGETRALGAAWRLAETSGAALAEVVATVAGDLAARLDRRRRLAVALTGARSSALLLAGLPGIGLALGAAMGADPLGFLLGDPRGRLVGCAGVLLDAGGVLAIRALTRRVERA